MTVNVDEKVAQLASQFGHALQKYGPQAWESVKQIKQIESIGWLIPNLVWLAVGLVALIFYVKLVKSAFFENFEKRDWDISDEAAVQVGTCFAGFAVGAAILIPIVNLSSIWLWVGVFNPGLAIAHDILVKLTR